ncbi:MAG: hypothetical protein ACKVH8_02680 [Pirellulales bacterium]
MSRRRGRRQTLTMSLFPFLAVLICTMGALIVLLVVLVLDASLEAETVAATIAYPLPEIVAPVIAAPVITAPIEPAIDIAEINRKNEETLALLQKRKEIASGILEDQRLQLSGIEDHTRELVDELKRLRIEIELLEKQEEQKEFADGELEERTALLEKQLAEGEERLEELQKEARKRKPAYALIPYDGSNGTKRRPIYIECTKDKIIIQPEGIEFVGADFRKPLGVGNPLDSALRAVREYRSNQGIGRDNPYPLLVVRPGGAESYSAARDAMQSWDSEFGYELVDEDLELAYPESDPFLAKRLIETVDIARRRKLALIMSAPGEYGRAEESGMLSATSNGGFSSSGSGNSDGDSPFESNRFIDQGQSLVDNNLPGNQAANEFQRSGDIRSESPYGQPNSSPRTSNGFYQASSPDPVAAANSSSPMSGGTDPQSTFSEEIGSGTQSGQYNPMGSRFTSPSQTQGQYSATGQSQPQSSTQADQNSQNNRQPSGSSKNTNSSAMANGAQSKPGTANLPAGTGGSSSSASTQPVAATRGRDWALPSKGSQSIAYSRPIRVQCFADQIILVPEHGSRKPVITIKLEANARTAIDEMVNKIWKRIDTWGIAGTGGYWKPILNVEVGPGADWRFNQLQTLLEGSGIEVRRVN